jgi:hypothetical protein
MILPHHQRVIDRLIDLFQDDPRFPAMIIGGSVAKGRARPDSDVDVMLIATDEEYARRVPTHDFWYINRDLCDYPGGYVEGKILDMSFLRDAADHGSETARAAFVDAFLGYSHLPEVAELLARIPVYQERVHTAKLAAFFGQVCIFKWYVGEAEERQDRYLLTQAVANLALYGGRLILAHNRILFPYHKWFLYDLRRAEQKPDHFVDLLETLVAHPSKEHAQAFYDSLAAFRDWGITPGMQAAVQFARDTEWNWRDGRPPLQDW